MIKRVLVFGDDLGVPQTIKYLPSRFVCGIVAAEIRPHQHDFLQSLAKQSNLPLMIQPKASSPVYPVFVEKVSQLNPDLILVNSYSMLLRPEVLAIPRYGAVNVHAALLPQYRGPNPTQWALLNDETETGVTIHYMDRRFDAGDIIAQRRVPIYFNDTWLDIQAQIGTETERLLQEEIPQLLAGTNARQPQDEALAKKWRRRHPEDGLIDWQKSVHYLHNLVRALVKPNPGAFYTDVSGKSIVMDEYLPLTQITALKYGPAGGQMLKNEHLALTPLRDDDMTALMAWMNDRQQGLLNLPDKPAHESQHATWSESILRRDDAVIFGIRLSEDSRLIGFCQLCGIDHTHRAAELQIRMDATPHGSQGCLLEAVQLLLRFAFDDLNLKRVFLQVFSTNEAGIRLYEGAGFRKEGAPVDSAHIDGEYTDVTVMGIYRNEYKP